MFHPTQPNQIQLNPIQSIFFTRAAGASAPEVGYGAPGEEKVLELSCLFICIFCICVCLFVFSNNQCQQYDSALQNRRAPTIEKHSFFQNNTPAFDIL